jgi:multidrug resistance efflux pump
MNVETDVNLTKKKRIIFWIYLLTILLFFIAITILAVYSWTPTKTFLSTDNYYYANQVAKEWQMGIYSFT